MVRDAILTDGGRRIENTYTISPELKPYFVDTKFYVEYPRSVSEVPKGILNIPALSTVVHFAVAVGADVEVQGEVDAEYLKAAGEAQAYLKTAPGFESLKCITRVSGEAVRTPAYDAPRTGLLFSGGSDSTCSWVKRRAENPLLYMVWGLDVLTWWPEFWEKIRAKYVDELHIPNLRIVKSNTEDLYATNQLYSLGAKLTEGYRPTYSFSVNALGLLAPLTYLDGVGLLQLSSTYPSRHYLNSQYPWARYRPSFIVNQFWRWGNTRCAEVDHEYSTTEKIRYFLKPHVDAGNTVFLRSCGNRKLLQEQGLKNLNCGYCDKCQRTIGMLAVNGIDPRRVGFPVNDAVWARTRSDIEGRKWNPVYLKYHWEEVKGLILDPLTEDFGGSRAFFNWLKTHRFV
jgi:hypothetical protein